MKKRWIAIAVAALSVLSLAGCNKLNVNAHNLTDYSENVTVGDYKGLKIEVEKVEVTDKEVQAEIDKCLNAKTTYEQVTDRVVADKDSIVMDFTGYYIKDDGTKGEKFERGEATNYDYTIGGSFIESLNDQLIGLECGKEVDLKCKFPDDYSNSSELAGKDVIFTVKVHYIKGKPIVPEWNDEFVKDYTKNLENKFETAADFESYLRKQLEDEAEKQVASNYEALLWQTIIDNSEIKEYPKEAYDKLYDMYLDQVNYYIDLYAQYMGAERDEFLKSYGEMFFGVKDEDGVKEMAKGYAETELDSVMIAVEISKKEGITVPKEEYESLASNIVKEGGFDSQEKLEENVGINYLMETFIMDKVTVWLKEHNEQVMVDAVTPSETDAANQTEAQTETSAQ